MNKVTSAGGFVVKDNKVLLIKLDSGKYALPKGHVETGETFEEATIREVEEETGVNSVVINYLGDYTRPSEENDGTVVEKTIKIYLLKQTRYTEKNYDENSAWVNIQDAINNMHFEQETNFIKELQLR